MPSMNSSGWLDRLIDDAPRIRMVVPAPAEPDCEVSATPGTRDSRRFDTELMGAVSVMLAAETDATSAACALRSRLPAVPVMTSSDSVTSEAVIWRSRVVVWPATTTTVSDVALKPSR